MVTDIPADIEITPALVVARFQKKVAIIAGVKPAP